MFSFLQQPYPISEKGPRQQMLNGLLVGTFVTLFLIIFQPFGTDDVDFPRKNLFLAGYGFITAITIWVGGIVSYSVATPAKWTVGKQLITVLSILFLGITISYFYLLLLDGSPSWRSYRIFVTNALLVAVFPVVGITVADYIIKLRRYERGAREFNLQALQLQAAPAPAPGDYLQVLDEQERPLAKIPMNHIWCLRSDRNYVDLFHLDASGRPQRTTVRNTLTKLAEQLTEDFVRCHRSYIVNVKLVESIAGNAQGYRLLHPDFELVPALVSRSKSKEMLEIIRAIRP